MSIVRMGMSEDDKFGAGYDAIFGTKPAKGKKAAKGGAPAKPGAKAEKKDAPKKGAKKK
jgi:hypothetical protein